MSLTIENVRSLSGLNTGDYVVLTDQETLTQLLSKPHTDLSRQWAVVDTVVVVLKSFKYWIAQLESEGETLHLAVKQANHNPDAFELGLYFEPGGMPQFETAAQWIRDGRPRLFAEPADITNFQPGDLDFAEEFNQDLDDGRKIVYKRKLPTDYGHLTGWGDFHQEFVGVAEWSADISVSNPEVLALGVGGLKQDGSKDRDGSKIVFLQGSVVNPNDVTSYRKGGN